MSDEPPAKKAKKGDEDDLPACPYGARCYRKNPQHFKEFSHPPKGSKEDDSSKGDSGSGISIDTSKLPPCKYGASCYRKNLLHYAEYSHPFSGAGPTLSEDSGSDTDVIASDEEDGKKKGENEVLKRGMSLVKKYSQMTEEERKELIKKAFEAKHQLEKELEETNKKMEEKDKELKRLQDEVNEGVLMLDGESEALKGTEIKYFTLHAERDFKEGSAAQAHFRLAESQFYRLLQSYGGNTKISKVEYVVNPKLCKKFGEAREEIKKKRGEEFSYPVLAFHGTQEKNITPICTTGFKVPGQDGHGHRTDTGYYGKGVYFSEYPNYSMSYIAGSTKLMLCKVLLGKVYQCTKLIHGAPLTTGYDSHMSPNKKELVIFNTFHILPSYIVHYTNSTSEFKYLKPIEERKIVEDKKELMELYKKAVKKHKTAIFFGKAFMLSGKLCDTYTALKNLIKKHGGLAQSYKGSAYNVLITTKADYESNSPKVQEAKLNSRDIVSQEFLFDSIIAKAVQDVENYYLQD